MRDALQHNFRPESILTQLSRMPELFSKDWMESFQQRWNSDPEIKDVLSELGFNAVIGYGYSNDPSPSAMVRIEQGKIVYAGDYQGQQLTWDLRAEPDQWQQWMDKPPNMIALGIAFSTGKIVFETGDYSSMMKEPRFAGPFVKSFEAMTSA